MKIMTIPKMVYLYAALAIILFVACTGASWIVIHDYKNLVANDKLAEAVFMLIAQYICTFGIAFLLKKKIDATLGYN